MAQANGRVKLILRKTSGITFNLAQALDTATCFVESRPLDLGDARVSKFIQKLLFDIYRLPEATNLWLVLKWANQRNGPFTTYAEYQLGGSVDGLVDTKIPQAKYFVIRLEDRGIRVLWKLTKLEIFGAIGGKRLRV